MKNYVFGYGSLINLESAEKTLGRAVRDEEVRIVDADDFARLWRLVVQVTVTGYRDNPVNAVFLDIVDQVGEKCNGILIEVSKDELERLDVREKYYDRIDITENVRPRVSDGKVFVYQGNPKFFAENFPNPRILAQYKDIVRKGTLHWGKDFARNFEQTTRPHRFETIEGPYKFHDPDQNIVTGRG